MVKTVLLTLGRLPKALTLARALHGAGYRVVIAEPFKWHVCKPSRAVAKCYRVPAPNVSQADYLDALLDIVRSESVDLVLPVSEEALHVAELHRRLPDGVTLLCPPAGELHALHDKFQFAARARAMDLSVPGTFRAEDANAELLAAEMPYVVKPVAGCSGIGLALCDAGTPLPDQRDDLLVQQRVEGRHVSTLSLLVDGRSLVTVCYEGTVYAGTVAVCFQRVDDAPAVLAWVNRFCSDLSYTGFIAFDFIVDADGVPWAIECNPRVTSGVHFLDEAALGLALADLPAAPSIPVRRDHNRFQWAYSTLTEAYAALFRPREFARRMGQLFSARDVVWSLRDPMPFLLMTPMSWEILWPAMTSAVSMGEATQRDIAWLSGSYEPPVAASIGVAPPGAVRPHAAEQDAAQPVSLGGGGNGS